MSNKNGLNHQEMLVLITFKEPKNTFVSVFQGLNKVLKGMGASPSQFDHIIPIQSVEALLQQPTLTLYCTRTPVFLHIVMQQI